MADQPDHLLESSRVFFRVYPFYTTFRTAGTERPEKHSGVQGGEGTVPGLCVYTACQCFLFVFEKLLQR